MGAADNEEFEKNKTDASPISLRRSSQNWLSGNSSRTPSSKLLPVSRLNQILATFEFLSVFQFCQVMYVIGPYVSIRQLIDFGDFSDAPDRQRAKFEIMSQFYVVIFSNKGIKNMSAELELRLT